MKHEVGPSIPSLPAVAGKCVIECSALQRGRNRAKHSQRLESDVYYIASHKSSHNTTDYGKSSQCAIERRSRGCRFQGLGDQQFSLNPICPHPDTVHDLEYLFGPLPVHGLFHKYTHSLKKPSKAPSCQA